MKRLLLLGLLLGLSSCVPAFRAAGPTELSLTYNGATLTLNAPTAPTRGSVGIRATGTVESRFCANVCKPDSNGVVLLQLLEGKAYRVPLALGRVEGLVRARAVVVFGAKEAVIAELGR